MPRLLRRRRYLACFYCGGKTSTLYDGQTRRFNCPFCEATNYLDENGEITDPPVATEKEATPRRPAVAAAAAERPVARPASTPERPSSNVFCSTCLKNQHLLTSSLAQYLPDPDDPEYEARERGLPRYRKLLERIYPQICPDCEPKVRRRLDQAAYTAKTDLLRRMLDRTAQERKSDTSRRIQKFDTVGRRLWVAANVSQLSWQLIVVADLVTLYAALFDVGRASYTSHLLRVLEWLSPLSRLGSTHRLLDLSILATVLGVWWNPRFSHVARGLSKHIRGLWTWWLLQFVSLVLRVGMRKMDLARFDPVRFGTQMTGHAAFGALCLFLFVVGPRVVQPNAAPLIGKAPPPPPSPPPQPGDSPDSSPDQIKSIADLLNDISNNPTPASPPSPSTSVGGVSPVILRTARKSLPMGHIHRQDMETFNTNLSRMGTLHLEPSSSSSSGAIGSAAAAHDDADAMDWTPTYAHTSGFSAALQSPYRAFNTRGQREGERFNAAPTEPNRGVFWYRVPPAPTTPAQRVFNPPNQPGRLRPSPLSKTASPTGGGASTWTPEQGIRFGGAGEGARGGGPAGWARPQPKPAHLDVTFAPPRIWPETLLPDRVEKDPRTELVSSFSQGFKLEDDWEEGDGQGGNRGGEGGQQGGAGWLGKIVPWFGG
ncbi:hypothetical protein VTJ83DRAFT_6384 [Remersonia thermophila]|uniref:Ima1 N-terminal domain-containing protein n=1 Tax=Remersonia thermophila TaxID=72144 RepID=A0ABR4D4I8_9PEZI